MRGSADAGVDGSILAARLTQARISAGDDFKADIVNSANVIKATVRGASLDARPFIKSMTEQGSPSQAGAHDFDIDMKIATVAGANKQSISGLELNVSRRGGDDRLAFLRGRIGQGTVSASRRRRGRSPADVDRRGRARQIRRPLSAHGGRQSRSHAAHRRRLRARVRRRSRTSSCRTSRRSGSSSRRPRRTRPARRSIRPRRASRG